MSVNFEPGKDPLEQDKNPLDPSKLSKPQSWELPDENKDFTQSIAEDEARKAKIRKEGFDALFPEFFSRDAKGFIQQIRKESSLTIKQLAAKLLQDDGNTPQSYIADPAITGTTEITPGKLTDTEQFIQLVREHGDYPEDKLAKLLDEKYGRIKKAPATKPLEKGRTTQLLTERGATTRLLVEPPTPIIPPPIEPEPFIDHVVPPKPKVPTDEVTIKGRVGVIDTSRNVDARVSDRAGERMTEPRENLSGFWGSVKKFWKYGIGEGFYRQREMNKARSEILTDRKSDRSFFTEEEGGMAAMRKSSRDITERYLSQLDDQDILRANAGEQRRFLDTDKPEELKVKVALEKLVKDFAGSQMTVGDFEEAKWRIFDNELKKANTGMIDRGEMFADNIIAIAEEARKAVESGAALNKLNIDLEITFGRAMIGAETEAKYTLTDRAVDYFKNKPLLNLLNETTIAAGVSAALYLSGRFVRSNVAALLSFGGTAAIAGGVAYSREHQMLAQERQLDQRQMAVGRILKNPDNSPRRDELKAFLYETKSASLLTNDLLSKTFESDGKTVKQLTDDQLKDVTSVLAEIEARIAIGSKDKTDLISFSSEADMEQERTSLYIARARVKAELGKRANFRTQLEKCTTSIMDQLRLENSVGTNAKDKLFNDFRTKAAGRKAAQALVAGLLIGATMQEIFALAGDQIREWAGTSGRTTQTPVESLWGWISGKSSADGNMTGDTIQKHFGKYHELPGHRDSWTIPEGKYHEVVIGNAPPTNSGFPHMNSAKELNEYWKTQGYGFNHWRLPEGVNIVKSDGKYDFVQGDTIIAKGVELTKAGTATVEGNKILEAAGLNQNLMIHHFDQKYEEVSKLNVHDFIKQHKGDMVLDHRHHWNDNGTPMYRGTDGQMYGADHNELRLDFGGSNNNGLTKDGKFVFNVGRMTKDGSWHTPFRSDAPEAIKNSSLKVMLSISEDSQRHVFEIPIDKAGNAIIDPHSPAGQLFKVQNGHAVFLGRFAEVADVVSTNKDGSVNTVMLATHEGQGLHTLTSKTEKHIIEPVRRTMLTFMHQPKDVELPPIIPILPRYPLEPTKVGRKPEPIPPYGGYYGYGNTNSMESIRNYFKSINAKPEPYNFIVQDGKQVAMTAENKPVTRNAARERERIKNYLERQDVAYRAELERFVHNLEPMKDNCRVAINIPARFEEKNLGNLLEQYSKQVDMHGKPLDPSLYEINIIVNRKKSESPDNSLRVIKEWKSKHPNINVNVIDIAFDDKVARVGIARKYITDIALLRSLQRENQGQPLYIETEDADLFAIDRKTVASLITQFDELPHIDVLRGKQDRQPEILMKNDLLFFQRRLWDIMETVLRNQKYRPERNSKADFVWHRIVSGGWNTAYSAESFAQIGGYDASMIIGEDMDIGQKISVLRGKENDQGSFIPNTQTAKTSGIRSNSSPRRFIDALAKKISPYEDFENQSLKHKTLDQLLDDISQYAHASQEQISEYEQTLHIAASFLRDLMPDRKDWQPALERTLFYVGIPKGVYEIDTDGNVKLKNMTTIINLLEQYKREKRYEQGYRRQNNPLGITQEKQIQPTKTEIENKKLQQQQSRLQKELDRVKALIKKAQRKP